jgi:hypothetical protein
VVSVVVNTSGVTTVARATSKAVNHSLRVKINWGGVVILEQNVESVSKSRGGALSPA